MTAVLPMSLTTQAGRERSQSLSPARKRQKSTFEAKVVQEVRSLDGYWHALQRLSQATGLPDGDLQALAEDLCCVCWEQAKEVASSDALLTASKEEITKLKDKINRCNLAAMKDIAAAKAVKHHRNDLGEDLVAFHEPLQFLDDSTKELVLTVANEKVRLLEDGVAPPSLIEALIKQAGGGGGGSNGGGSASKEELEELENLKFELGEVKRSLHEERKRADEAEQAAYQADAKRLHAEQETRTLQYKADALKESLAKAEELSANLKQELETAQEVLAETQARLEAAEAEAAAAKEALEELQGRHAALQEEHAQLQEAYKEAEARLAEAVAEAETAKKELEELQEKHAALEEQNRSLQQQVAEQQRRVEKLSQELEAERNATASLREQVAKQQEELKSLRAEHEALLKEVEELRAELARRNNTRTQGVQTTVTGPKLEEDKAERKRLKLMVEELQTKMKELLEKMRRKGLGKEVQEAAKEVGLQDVLKEQTVFERLYDDAVHRAERLEKLREKVRKERRELFPEEPERKEASVMDSVAQSNLIAAHKLVKDLPLSPSSSSAPAPTSPAAPAFRPAAPVALGFSPPSPVSRNRLAPPTNGISVSVSTSTMTTPSAASHAPTSPLDLEGGLGAGRHNSHNGHNGRSRMLRSTPGTTSLPSLAAHAGSMHGGGAAGGLATGLSRQASVVVLGVPNGGTAFGRNKGKPGFL